MKFNGESWRLIVLVGRNYPAVSCGATKMLLNKRPAGLENPGETSFTDRVKKKTVLSKSVNYLIDKASTLFKLYI